MTSLTDIQIDILHMAAATEVGPSLPAEIIAEPTIGGLLELGLLELTFGRVEITAAGRRAISQTSADTLDFELDQLAA